ncbi:Retrovirus-related Pol polyprotein from transposon TNT 1-94 [Morella rubra]|uniref:Retrovirus-related Pol polyprotein from transposon TNT 1-94 n=1 Tax=Morella rubra TaxID=262757 RepID=A0A6A1WU20_9ROSI|nr:Retrovirus-related Pol polyprotein from transposon TNT 1-94 [Morella rubra]
MSLKFSRSLRILYWSIKKLRSDRGSEYTSKEFDKFCEDEGVEHQLTIAYTPQQNGVSERKNRTVMEMAISMLMEKGLPKMFWAEAVYTAVYLLNRCPTKAVQDKTPVEAWSGLKSSAKHLRVFGSICYIHIPAQRRHKLEEKSQKGIFLGYGLVSKGYRVYNLETKKLTFSRDVKFDENAAWNWEAQTTKRKSVFVPEEVHADHTRQHHEEEDVSFESGTPSASPGSFSQSSSSQETSSPETSTGRVRSLREIYETYNFTVMEPENYEIASQQEEWVKAMEEEKKMIEKNRTWEIVDRPEDKDTIGVKWVYKTKLNPDGSIQKFKARLVVKGYKQQPGIDYNETFVPVARFDTIRALVALVAQKEWKIF